MSDKPLKVETKKRVKRTVTLYTEDGANFECPVIQRVTGKVHDRVIPILEEYEKGLGEPVPEFIAVMQSLEGEEREAYVNAHAVEIGTYVQTVTGALTKLQQQGKTLTPRQIAVTRTYTLKMLQAILDTKSLTDDQVLLVDSPIDSDFWGEQDLEEARDHVDRFRRRLA